MCLQKLLTYLDMLIVPHALHCVNSCIFSSAVFQENDEILSEPWRLWGRGRRRRCAKTLTLSNFAVITEDIYLKLGVVVHYQKRNSYQ